MSLRVGSLFSGYGGLELGIEQVLPAETAWHVEYDAAPSRILAHHWPDVPNYGDITTVNWATVEPVDILCGGFPCQDVSLAGLRKGLHPDTRSGLWSHFALAIDALRPPLVIVENVRGLLSAQAASNLEPDAWDLGDRNVRPPLRALGAVLGDLADLGYDARWAGVRAADAGAPHGRFRIFLLAQPADPDGQRHGRREDRRMVGRLDRHDESPPRERERARTLTRDRSATAPADPDSRRRSGQPPTRDPDGNGPLARRRPATAPDTRGSGRGERPECPSRAAASGRQQVAAESPDSRRSCLHWGAYEPAVRRWESVTGRLAPAPTETSPKGARRLSPAFVEWMMGLQPGHVTDPTIGLTRNEQLKALGNGVVPQQAALALSHLLDA